MSDIGTGTHKHHFFKELLKAPEHIAHLNKGVHKAGDIANSTENAIKSGVAEAAKIAEENKTTDKTDIKTYKTGKSDTAATLKLDLNNETETDKKIGVKAPDKKMNSEERKANSMIDSLMKDH